MNKDSHQIYENYKSTSANQEIINEGLVSRIGSRVAGVGSALTGGGYQAGKINAYKAAANKKINALTRELATDLQKLGINVDVAKLSNQMASQINNQMDGMVNSILTGSNQSTATSGSSVTPAVQSSTASTPEVTPNATAAATASNPQQQGSKAGQWLRRAGQAAGETVGKGIGGLVGGVQQGYKQATANTPQKPASTASQGVPPVLPKKETTPAAKTTPPKKQTEDNKKKQKEEDLLKRIKQTKSYGEDEEGSKDEDCDEMVYGVKTRAGLMPQKKPSKFFP